MPPLPAPPLSRWALMRTMPALNQPVLRILESLITVLMFATLPNAFAILCLAVRSMVSLYPRSETRMPKYMPELDTFTGLLCILAG